MVRRLYTVAALLAAAPAVNRGLRFNGTNQTASLPGVGPGLSLGAGAWSLEVRVRPESYDDGYVLQKYADAGGPIGDVYAITYGIFNVGKFSFWNFQRLQGGGNLLVQLNTATPPGQFYTVRFDYDGVGSLKGYLNGVLDVSYDQPVLLNDQEGQELSLAWSARNLGVYELDCTIDYAKVVRAGETLVDITLDEAAAPYLNHGTSGGTLTLVGSPTPVVL